MGDVALLGEVTHGEELGQRLGLGDFREEVPVALARGGCGDAPPTRQAAVAILGAGGDDRMDGVDTQHRSLLEQRICPRSLRQGHGEVDPGDRFRHAWAMLPGLYMHSMSGAPHEDGGAGLAPAIEEGDAVAFCGAEDPGDMVGDILGELCGARSRERVEQIAPGHGRPFTPPEPELRRV
jgi:hypothetical protein